MDIWVVVYESGRLALGFPNKVRAYANESTAKGVATGFTRRSRGDAKFKAVRYSPAEE